MTGCPNGCARPYNSDIGLVGKTKDKYTIFLGGRVLGDRLNFIYKDLVPTDEVVPTLVPVLRYFKRIAQAGRIVRRLLPPQGARTTCWPPAASCGPGRKRDSLPQELGNRGGGRLHCGELRFARVNRPPRLHDQAPRLWNGSLSG